MAAATAGRAVAAEGGVNVIRIRQFRIGAPLVLAVLGFAHAASAQAKPPSATLDSRDINLHAYIELMRSDLRSQKVAIITEVMEFTEEEDAKFWPVYRQYETELAAINDERMALIKQYADSFDALTDETADRLAKGALAVEAKRHELKTKYYDRFKAALGPKTSARFLQVENQILLLLDLQIAASLPVVSR
jgi:hypothetical protein